MRECVCLCVCVREREREAERTWLRLTRVSVSHFLCGSELPPPAGRLFVLLGTCISKPEEASVGLF